MEKWGRWLTKVPPTLIIIVTQGYKVTTCLVNSK